MVFEALSAVELPGILFLQGFQNPLLTVLMNAITFLGSPIFWILVAAFLYWKGEDMRSFFLMNLIVFAAVFAGALKTAVARPRPGATSLATESFYSINTFSMPSGHATLAGAVFGLYYFLKRWYAKTLLAIALLVAFSRVYLGVHFFSDVIVGLILGFFIGEAVFKLKKRFFSHGFRLSKLKEEIIVLVLLAISVLALIAFAELPLTAAVIGFYLGFFLFKEQALKPARLTKKTLIVKQALGFTGLTLMSYLTVWAFTTLTVFALYFLGGFWISFLYPFLWENLAVKSGLIKAFTPPTKTKQESQEKMI